MKQSFVVLYCCPTAITAKPQQKISYKNEIKPKTKQFLNYAEMSRSFWMCSSRYSLLWKMLKTG